ncbi:hypothetical protein QCA50_009354 [Cerrena zonata]|uniref:Uncharacterized protein n=1 Tax=Cerrena zonata TaxID=2478898 RepID=A0AAW0GC14_9APHY
MSVSPIKSVQGHLHQSLSAIRSNAHDHVHAITSNKSDIRPIDVNKAEDDVDFLAQIGLLVAASRQTFAFARDKGLPFVYNYVKYVNPKYKVPVRAVIFDGILCLVLGLLILIDTTAANALFSLAVVGNQLAWVVPVLLVLLPVGRSRFVPGPFYLGPVLSTIINIVTVLWGIFVMIFAMFPDSKSVTKDTMNYTCVINMGIWLLALLYYYVYGYTHYSGPVSNLDEDDPDSSIEGRPVHNIDSAIAEKI